ncbi:hypothetical protein WICPIJ_009414 [Wickerhamomyces pijperi]|uniref:Phosphoribosylaminoimidazole carboxylase n=1 Tax=Wickerhamomyces pijperi TaxID=599730 RepID=A0A9P8PPI4_WICPI|nr:hypothetical protein WICPIJ_009414 [Wickerhamomyces pijperi]
MENITIGILGGGQLGRMIVEASHRLNIKTIILDAANSPAKQINALDAHVDGSFNDEKAIMELAGKVDVMTIEIEHINVDAIKRAQEAYPNLKVYPVPETIKLIQDKYLQKLHLIDHGIQVTESIDVENTIESLAAVGDKFGYPYLLKARTLAYDGRGNFVVKTKDDLQKGLDFLSNRSLYAEKFAPFIKELAVMVVRSIHDEVFSYPVVETIHENNICHLVYAPARVEDSIQFKAQMLAKNAIKTFPGCGIFGVEMFLLANGELLINEIAPRPHNSGHYTIDACVTSQFEAHVRAIADLPLPKNFARLATSNTNAIMLNVLGAKEPNGELAACKRALETPGASVYLYGKTTRYERKMGHINIVSDSMGESERKLKYILGETASFDEEEEEVNSKPKPLVSIVMGSDSDLPVMSQAAGILEKFNIPFELSIVSAHRTPYRMQEFANSAVGRGIKVIIAGAGGAAHLPGMIAAMTALPVIGVPVKGSTLDGVDSLYSIVQMPRGIPVATVAINNSTNAALLAVRILGGLDVDVLNKMEKFLVDQEREVLDKVEVIEAVGYKKYLAEHLKK